VTDDQAKQAERIQALLAKAESTTHPAEADAYMAKAQELMTKYAIDELQLVAQGKLKSLGEIVTVKVDVPAPHADVKIQGIHWLSFLHQCRVVMGSKQFKPGSNRRVVLGQSVWITGYEHDVERLQLTFTSLSVQCTNEMLKATKPAHVEVTEFRRAFVYGYFDRVTTRLREAHERTQTEAVEAFGGSLLPALVDKGSAVDRAYAEQWEGQTTRGSLDGIGSRHGRRAGREAGDRADLGHTRFGQSKGAIR